MPKNPPPADEPAPPTGEIVLYQTEDGRTRVECRFVDETLWLSRGEVQPAPTIRKFRIVRREGPRDVEREIEHYSLDAILAVGYRVRSERGTQFRRWATERLSEHLVKGFTMDDQRLKNPPVEGSSVPDYFDELLERIRDIRASERRMQGTVEFSESFRTGYTSPRPARRQSWSPAARTTPNPMSV